MLTLQSALHVHVHAYYESFNPSLSLAMLQLSVLLSNELSSIHQILPNEMHNLD
jgi:hypothetical protein